MTLILLGTPGCGKTRIGKQFAQKLGVTFLDTDELLLENFANKGESVRDVYQRVGEVTFRQLEEQVLALLTPSSAGIISLGGGTLISEKSRSLAAMIGQFICLYEPFFSFYEKYRENLPAYASCQTKLKEVYDLRLESFRKVSATWLRVDSPQLFTLLEEIYQGGGVFCG